MSELDKKLIPILDELKSAPKHRSAGAILDALPSIKQAFVEDGWRWVPTQEQMQPYLDSGCAQLLETKEEWERQAVKDGWVKITGDCLHEWSDFRDGKGHHGEKCMLCYDFRHMIVDEQDVCHDENLHLMDPLPMNTTLPPNKMMSGQDFYDRFEKEYRTKPAVQDMHLLSGGILMDIEDVKSAARKAAGLE